MADGFAPIDPDTEDVAWLDLTPEPPEDPAERIRRAFDAGADLDLNPPPAAAQPGEAEGRTRRRRRRGSGGKAVGGDAMGAMAVAGFAIMVTFVIGDWATPTEDEANALATPIGNMLARRIDLASKLGADADDTILLMLALMSYGARVAPEAVNRSRDAYKRSRDRKPVLVPPGPKSPPVRPSEFPGAGGVSVGQDDGPHPTVGAPGSPIDVLTRVSERQWRGLGLGTQESS